MTTQTFNHTGRTALIAAVCSAFLGALAALLHGEPRPTACALLAAAVALVYLLMRTTVPQPRDEAGRRLDLLTWPAAISVVVVGGLAGFLAALPFIA